MNRGTARQLAIGLVVAVMGSMVWAGVVSAEVVLCKSRFFSVVKAREGSCRRRETEIVLSATTDTLADLNCTVDQIAKYDGAVWVCEDDPATTDTLADLNCTVDQIAKYDGAVWVCEDDSGAARSV